MSTQRVTLAVLAKSLKLSTCTVSKILNKSLKGVRHAPETIRRVEEAAERMGYRANAQARALRTRRSQLIGFLLPSAQTSVFGELTDRLEFELRAFGLHLLIGHSRNSADEEARLLSMFLSHGVDGLLWIPSRERLHLADYQLPKGFPVVVLDRPASCAGAVHVITDNRKSSRLLAQRIYDHGHRHVAVLNSSPGDRSMKERLAGIEDVFGASLTVADGENTAEAGRGAADRWFEEPWSFTALVALSEPLAIGALGAMRDHDIAAPHGLSFAAFDDFPLAAHWSPRITVLRQDIPSIARVAVARLSALLADPGSPVESVQVPAILEWRDSVTPR